MELKEIVSKFESPKPNGNNSYMVKCPCHNDNTQSLCISEKDNKILMNCFAGCSPEDITRAIGLEMANLFNGNTSRFSSPRPPSIEYMYSDRLKKVRFYKLINGEWKKSFCWYHKDDSGKWQKGKGEHKVPLYKQSVLSSIIADETVYIVEGEKDVDTMTDKLSFKAVSAPNGATKGSTQNKWNNGYNELFKGLNVAIVPDNDDIGRTYAKSIAAQLLPIAKSVKILDLRNEWDKLKEKGDITDIYESITPLKGKTPAETVRLRLSALTNSTKLYERENDEAQAENVQQSDEMPPYIIKNSNGYSVSKPLLAEYIRKNCHYFLVSSRKRTKVFWYDSGVYKPVNDNMFQGYIKKHITDFDLSLLKMRDVEEIAKDIKTDLNFIDETKLNSNEDIINFKNGLYSISDGKLYPHTPNEYTTIQLPCNYNPDNTNAPVFEKFINSLCEGDEQKKTFLLEYMGVAISNIYGYRMKKTLFMYGKGNTGKTQPKTLIERLLGHNNFGVCDLKQLESRWGASNLYGKRLVGYGDVSFTALSELKTFKNITGGDSIPVEFKGEDSIEYTYTGLLWYCMNELPAFGGDKGEWVYDRIVAFDCNNVIPPDKRDPKLCDKMYAEREAIINLLIPYINKVIKAGYNFSVPDKCKENVRQYMDDNSPIRTFVKECCIPVGRECHKYRTSEMYQAFKEWYKENVSPIAYSNQKFRKELAQICGCSSEEVKFKYNGYEYFIITLNEQAEKRYYPYGPYRP